MTKVKNLKAITQAILDALGSRKRRMVVWSLLSAITVFLGYHLYFLEFDYQFDKLFPSNDPQTRIFREHRAEFDDNTDFLFVLISDSSSFFDEQVIENIRSFEQDIRKDSMVVSTTSPGSLIRLNKTFLGLVPSPLLGADNDQLKKDSLEVLEHPVYSQFFGKDRKSGFVFIKHHRENDANEAFLNAIRASAANHNIDQYMIVGPAEAQRVFIEFIQKDFSTFLFGSVFLSFSLLMLIFRDLRSAILPFILSVLSSVWLFGLMSFLGYKINILSVLLPPIIFFVAISDIIHLMNGFKKSQEKDLSDKISDALDVAFRPTLLTSVTTAIGFLSLLWINTEPIQQLGIFASIGVLMAFLLTYSLGVLYLFHVRIKSFSAVQMPGWYTRSLMKRKRSIYALFLLFTLISVPGIFKITTNAFIMDDLPEDSQVRSEFYYADQQIGGVKTMEVRLELKTKCYDFSSPEIIKELVEIEDFLADSIGMTRSQSLVSGIKAANSILNDNSPAFYLVPDRPSQLSNALELVKSNEENWSKIVSQNGKAGVIRGFLKDEGTDVSMANFEAFESFKRDHLDTELIDAFITGPTFLVDRTNSMLSANLLKGLASAVGVIALFLGLYFRSWRLMIISLIPNLLPLLLIAGIIGWAGISLKMTSAILFTVAFGIAVDDTIHFMSYYMQNLKSGAPMDRTFEHAGSAMLITTIIMISGFGLFMISDFGATFFMGLFVSSALFLALLVDFSLLPLILSRFIKK